METGKYLSAEQAGQVKGNEFKELAAQLWYLRQDFGDGAKEAGLLPTVDGVYMQRGGFPEDTAKLEKLLQSPEQLAALRCLPGEPGNPAVPFSPPQRHFAPA